MEYTVELFEDFLGQLISFDEACRAAEEEADRAAEEREAAERAEWDKIADDAEQCMNACGVSNRDIFSECQRQMEAVFSKDIRDKRRKYTQLLKCKEAVNIIACTGEEITVDKDFLDELDKIEKNSVDSLSVKQLLSKAVDFPLWAYKINKLPGEEDKKDKKNKKAAARSAAVFYSFCRASENVLNEEYIGIKKEIEGNLEDLCQQCSDIGRSAYQNAEREWYAAFARLDEDMRGFAARRNASCSETDKEISESNQRELERMEGLESDFCRRFPPQEFLEEYMRLYALEPVYARYECCKVMPENVRIGTLEYDLSILGLSEYTLSFLDKYYYFMHKGDKLCIPCCASFGPEFNYLFQFDGSGRENIVKSACDLGMRLFMMMPPGKVNFTFIDPVTLGGSFAMFNRLVDVNDRTGEVINGWIWHAPADIEEKLKIMTDHIANVIQRCLQGKYGNIYEYNCAAGQNAEAYHVLMLMDYPEGLTERSLKLLEQITASGPKCGVFTIIYRNEIQYEKFNERFFPQIENIEGNFQKFHFTEGSSQIVYSDRLVEDSPLLWRNLQMPEGDEMDGIIAALKKGIQNVDKVVIGIEKASGAERTDSTKNGIRIPIGIRGAKDYQYLTLGVGGSQHALVVGITRSGKSSLLHTIIMQAMEQYRSPDELVIYLVDFKRGVEFKIYADYVLPMFKVIAIETEQEFGYNILEALDREQRVRADLFRRKRVDKIEEYRELDDGKTRLKMPRVLVIMDEFQELFSGGNDEIGKKSSLIMERIACQGAAFGIHLILSSQSYANMSGISKAAFNQMAVRIVFNCVASDADMLLENGGSEVKLLSNNDPGSAIYNSEGGNREYHSHFKVFYVEPQVQEAMLEKLSAASGDFDVSPARILLSNIEDNKYSIFNQFWNYKPDMCKAPGRLFIGEPLSNVNYLNMDLTRTDYANLLMIGADSDKARSMFAFAMLSLAINYWVSHGKQGPPEPFIYFLNYKPLQDSYFIDAPNLLAGELLKPYVENIAVEDAEAVKAVVRKLFARVEEDQSGTEDVSQYLFVFGYQRAEDLRLEKKESRQRGVLNMMSADSQNGSYSVKEMVDKILTEGPQKGVHSVFWHDSFKALDIADRNLITYFYQKIAFDMPKEEFSQFVGENDVSLIGENNAIYYNRANDNQKFRSYQSPDEGWLRGICERLS